MIQTLTKISLGGLYTFHISHFMGILQMFSQNTPRNAEHYTFRIFVEFCVLLMPQKNKPRNSSSFRAHADSGTKCCEMQKAKKGAQNTPLYTTFCFSFPFSHISR